MPAKPRARQPAPSAEGEETMPLEDKQLRRMCEREIAKFPVDVSKLNIRALNHIIYLEGRIRLVRGAAGATFVNLDKTVQTIQEVLMDVPGVREVITGQLIRDY
jgi:hypothetical protein